MARRRIRAVVAAAMLLAACRQATPAQSPDQPKPDLFLLTPLPIVWSEGFGLDQPGSPALEALEKVYRVTPIDLPSQLPEGALLLAAQPRALPAEELVALDAWVRRGGRLLLLADPLLEWPSELPLGDRRRAPLAFADTGLLRHWGLRLDKPERAGLRYGGREGSVAFLSPGTLDKLGGSCAVENGGSLAACALGRGQAVIVADADFLNLAAVRDSGGEPAANLDYLMRLLRRAG